jgi:hypothetical protein
MPPLLSRLSGVCSLGSGMGGPLGGSSRYSQYWLIMILMRNCSKVEPDSHGVSVYGLIPERGIHPTPQRILCTFMSNVHADRACILTCIHLYQRWLQSRTGAFV